MKKDYKKLLVTIFSILSFQAFTSLAALAEEDAFKIGATVPLSGDLATYGNLIVNGIELAKEDLKKDGINIQLATEDTPLAGGGVISALNKLITVDKVDAIAGNFSAVAMLAMGEILEKQEIPTFHTAAAGPAIIDFPKFVLSTNVRIKDEAYHIANYLHKIGFRKAGVIAIQTNFGEADRDFFEERFRLQNATDQT